VVEIEPLMPQLYADRFLRTGEISQQLPFKGAVDADRDHERPHHMNTILAINAISTLLAAVGIGGFLARSDRRARRESEVELAYVHAGKKQPISSTYQ
jgi:hypothetical protein